MARSLQITCDGCGRTKQEANHWIEICEKQHTLSIPKRGSGGFVPLALGGEDPSFTIRDFCGQECALKFIAEQMGKQG